MQVRQLGYFNIKVGEVILIVILYIQHSEHIDKKLFSVVVFLSSSVSEVLWLFWKP